MLSQIVEIFPALYVTGQFIHSSTLLVPTLDFINAIFMFVPYINDD